MKTEITPEQALEINLDEETNVETLRALVKFWQEKALASAIELHLIDNDKMKELFKKIKSNDSQNK